MQHRRVGSWVLSLLVVPLAGCGMKLVRPSVEPPAVDVRGGAAPLDVSVRCQVTGDADAGGALVRALRDAGVFRGEVSQSEPAGAPLVCDVSLRVSRVSEPVIETGARELLMGLAIFPPYLGVPFVFMWSDREPDLIDRHDLEVVVRGEEGTGVRYEALVKGTISAQTPRHEQVPEGLAPIRATLRDLAIESLVSRFADDHEALARLREQLDPGPALELEPLLVGKESHAPRARWRTRKLIGWKNESLAARVSEAKTSELRGMVSQLETCMLDLSHEAEVEKDAAQSSTAKGNEAGALRARELSLAYRERVEALRPILTAVKDELEGRGR